MPLPEEFFYYTTTYSRNGRWNTPGELDVTALLAGEPPFIGLTPELTKHQRTIILDAWAMTSVASPLNYDALLNLLKSPNRFTIYISLPLANGLVLLTLDNFDYWMSSEGNSNIVPCDEAKLQFIADTLGIELRKICVLDNFLMSQLVENNERRTMRLSHFTAKPDDFIDMALSDLQQKSPFELIIDEFSDRASEVLKKIQGIFPEYETQQKITVLNITQKDAEDLKTTSEMNNGIRVSASDLIYINSVYCYTEITPDLLLCVLQHTPNIRSLKLLGCSGLHNPVSPVLLSGHILTPQLQEIFVIGTGKPIRIQSALLYELISAGACTLSQLVIENSNIINLGSEGCSSLPNLRNLTLKACSSSLIAHDILEKSSCQLQSLQLSTDLCSLSFFYRFNSLKTLTFSGQELTFDVLERLTSLEHLVLDGCVLLGIKSALDMPSLKSLKSLTISNMEFCISELMKLIPHAPQLHSLKLKSCKKLHGVFSFVTKDFTELQILSVEDCSINADFLSNMLRHSPKISTLRVIKTQYANKGRIAHPLIVAKLSSLQEVDFSFSDIAPLFLNSVLKNSTNLTYLNVEGCKYLTGIQLDFNRDLVMKCLVMSGRFIENREQFSALFALMALEEAVFVGFDRPFLNDFFKYNKNEHLTSLKLVETTLDNAMLNKFTEKAHNLKKLMLSKAKIMLDEGNIHPMGSIDFLMVEDSDLTSETLTLLISSMPALRFLTIKNCINISYDEFSELKSGLHESDYITHTHEVPAEIEPDISVEQSEPLFSRRTIGGLRSPDNASSSQEVLLREREIDTAASSSQMSRSSVLRLPIEDIPPSNSNILNHNLNRLSGVKPTPDNMVFKYQGINPDIFFQQTNIIHQLSQFLKLSGNFSDKIIARLQKGLCTALSHWFLEEIHVLDGSVIDRISDWRYCLHRIMNWNGQEDSLDSKLRSIFVNLWDKVWCYQFENKEAVQYLGDNLPALIELLRIGTHKILLDNSWHMCSLLAVNGKFKYYNSNSTEGMRNLSIDNLAQTIKKELGSLICYKFVDNELATVQPILSPKISDINQFLADGGFIIIRRVENRQQLFENYINDVMATSPKFEKKALEGLLLRSKGVPAWIRCINDRNLDVVNLALYCLQQFLDTIPNAWQLLIDSMEHVSPNLKKQSKLSLCRMTQNSYRELRAQLHYLISSSVLKVDKISSGVHFPGNITTDDYCSYLLHLEYTKTLVKLPKAGVNGLIFALEDTAKSTGIPVFIINSVADTSLYTSLSKPDSEGLVSLGRTEGGVLHEFLQSNPIAPIFILDLTKMSMEEIVSTLEFMRDNPDLERSRFIAVADTSLPQYHPILDTKFFHVERCPISLHNLCKGVIDAPMVSDLDASTITINLFEMDDWSRQLLGGFVPKSRGIYHQVGFLQQEIEKGTKKVVIFNPPKDDECFNQAMQQLLNRKKIKTPAGMLELPDGFEIEVAYFYDWEELLTDSQWHSGLVPDSNVLVLNSCTLNDFYFIYNCDEYGNIVQSPGILEQNRGRSLLVNVTSDFSDGSWAKFLTACKQLNIKPHFYCAPNISLFKEPIGDTQYMPTVRVSNDVDASADFEMQSIQDKNAIVLDISGQRSYVLLPSVQATHREPPFKFEKTLGVLKKATERFDYVIVKAQFYTIEMADALAVFLLNPNVNILVLVPEGSESVFGFCRHDIKVIRPEDKTELLEQKFGKDAVKFLDRDLIKSYSLANLQSRLQFELNFREDLGLQGKDAGWEGLYSLPPISISNACQFEHSAEIAQKFYNKRMDDFQKMLQGRMRHVALTGITATGKTHFAVNSLRQLGSVCADESFLEKFVKQARRNPYKTHYMVYDEANFESERLEFLEGIYSPTPHVIYNSDILMLPDNLKFVLIINPRNYGNGRETLNFLDGYGNCMVFEPLPIEVIYQDIIYPLFEKTSLEHYTQEITQAIEPFYHFLVTNSEDKVLITLREIKTIIALVLMKYHQDNNPCLEAVLHDTRYYCFYLLLELVPKKELDAFQERFLEPNFLVDPNWCEETQGYVVTHSRTVLFNLLKDFLNLRKFCSSHVGITAMNCIMLQSNYGDTAKKSLVEAVLREHGESYKVIDPAMSASELKDFLTSAAERGAVVLAPNFDCLSFDSRLRKFLNELLSTNNNGFMLITTSLLDLESDLSDAEARRRITLKVPFYSKPELVLIASKKGCWLPEKLVDVYVGAKQKALSLRQFPPQLDIFFSLIEKQLQRQKLSYNEVSKIPDSPRFFRTERSSNVSSSSASPRDGNLNIRCN